MFAHPLVPGEVVDALEATAEVALALANHRTGAGGTLGDVLLVQELVALSRDGVAQGDELTL